MSICVDMLVVKSPSPVVQEEMEPSFLGRSYVFFAGSEEAYHDCLSDPCIDIRWSSIHLWYWILILSSSNCFFTFFVGFVCDKPSLNVLLTSCLLMYVLFSTFSPFPSSAPLRRLRFFAVARQLLFLYPFPTFPKFPLLTSLSVRLRPSS